MPGASARAAPYALVAPLGRGGMAEVWLAQSPSGARVALKRIAPNAPPDALDALAREAAAGRRLTHPGIVRLLDAGREPEGTPYLAFEYIDGPSLRERLASGPLREGDAVTMGEKLLCALDYAHGRGVVHNDIKPENILLAADGPKITDFGAAQGLTETVGPERARELMATLAYLAPEVLQGGSPSPRSDLYSLALTLYEAVAGKLPFSGRSPAAMAGQRLTAGVPPLRRLAPSASPRLERTLARALDPDPELRFPTAAAFAAALSPRHEPTAVLALRTVPVGDSARAAPAIAGRGPQRVTAAILGTLGGAAVFAAALGLGAFDRGDGDAGAGAGSSPGASAAGTQVMTPATPTATPTSTPAVAPPTATPIAPAGRDDGDGDGEDEREPKPDKPGNGNRRNFAPDMEIPGSLEALNSLLEQLRRAAEGAR